MCGHRERKFERGRAMTLWLPSFAALREAPGIWEHSHEIDSFPGPDMSLRLAVFGEIAGHRRPKGLPDRLSDVLSGMQSTPLLERPDAGSVHQGVLCDCGEMHANGRHRVRIPKRLSAVKGGL